MRDALPLRHHGFSVVATMGIALALALSTVGPAAAEQGICAVTAGTSGSHKYATLKCAKKSSPKNFVIRSTIWESKDKNGYQELARAAGHSFTCTLTQARSTTRATMQTITYRVSNCK